MSRAVASVLPAALALLSALMVSGCANGEIASAHHELTAGHYLMAHAAFERASHSADLSERERREAADGICLTEFKIGPPNFSAARQRMACAKAAQNPGSESSPLLAQIDAQERASVSAQVKEALRNGDPARAEEAIVAYQTFPGADLNLINQWSSGLWESVARRYPAGNQLDRRRVKAISTIAQRYPQMRSMKEAAFKAWVMRNATVENRPLVSGLRVGPNKLDLWVAENNLPAIEFNLGRFTRINDAMVARCRCDAGTDIAVAGSGLPAYLVRLDPETRQSEVLVMPQPR